MSILFAALYPEGLRRRNQSNGGQVMIPLLLKRLLCHHGFKFVRNLHGDEIIEYGWKRSLWRCAHCGKLHMSDYLDRTMEDQ